MNTENNIYMDNMNEIAKFIRTQKCNASDPNFIYNLISAVVFHEPIKIAEESSKIATEILYHAPTAFFWSKMQRFLTGTFKNYEEQLKFSANFGADEKTYINNVTRIVGIITLVETYFQVDYIANLTRAKCTFEIDTPLYFRLVKIIQNCTPDELDYLSRLDVNAHLQNSAVVSVLMTQGIIQQIHTSNGSYYSLSELGRYLKYYALNYGDDNFSIPEPKPMPLS